MNNGDTKAYVFHVHGKEDEQQVFFKSSLERMKRNDHA